jgi:hypothetical protein
MAAALYGKGQGEPPPALALAWRCQKWNTLPEAGGLFDQPLRVMRAMEAALYTAEAFTARARAAKAGTLVEWAEANPDKVSYCRNVDDMLSED